MSNATEMDSIFAQAYTLIKVDEYITNSNPKIIYQAFFPDDMLVFMNLLYDFEDKKPYYYLIDWRNMQIIKAANNVAERALKRALKGS